MKVVLDTNVLVAAIGFGGLCRAVLEVSLDAGSLCLSDHILDETHRNLVGKLKLPAELAAQHVTLLKEGATMVTPASVSPDACRDCDDLPVLGTLVAAEADALVTGDKDLLSLGTFGGRPILDPRQFWTTLST